MVEVKPDEEVLLPLDSASSIVTIKPLPRYCPHCGGGLDKERMINWGGWSFDETKNKFLAGTPGADVHLTAMEASIVSCLLRGHGEVVQKEGAMYSAICGNRPDIDWPEMKIVDVIVCKVRKKMREHNLLLAETSWAQGYFAVPYKENPTFIDRGMTKRIPDVHKYGKGSINAKPCTCNHLKSHHKYVRPAIANKKWSTSGMCLVEGCDCQKYESKT